MKKITYFFRPQSQNVSIERVFNTVLANLPEEYNFKIVILPDYIPKAKGLIGIVKAFLKVRSFCRKNAGTLNHITGDIHYCALFLPRKNTVLTIHDLISLKTLKGIKRLYIWLFWYYLPLKCTNNITCISQFTANQLIELFPWVKGKITIIPNPVGLEFIMKPQLFNKNCPTILHIGTRDNKNLERVIESLNGVNCHLRIIGNLSEIQLSLLKTNNIRYTNDIFVTDRQIVKEYEDCDIVSFPSTYEGFGMPIIEGQMTERIVLTSDISPMKDICGEGAYLVDPYDVISIRNGFKIIIADADCRKCILDNSRKNIQKYLPSVISNVYCQLYSQIKL